MSTSLGIVIAFFGVSILFYVLFAGADFGGGILDLFVRGKRAQDERRLIAHAMAPVWEANHIWLVLAIVILFTGFPHVYALISTFLYMPIMAVLVGIVFRGCAFTFRHYDPASHGLSQIYSLIFSLASIWTSMFLGIVAGAMLLGRITPDALSHYELFIAPWANSFCLTVGFFSTALFTLLAAIYLVGEANDLELRKIFMARARVAATIVVLTGPFVFLTAEWSGLPLYTQFVESSVSVVSFGLATLLLYPFWRSLHGVGNSILSRGLGAAIVSLVLFGCFGAHYPTLLKVTEGGVVKNLLFTEVAAPEATLGALRNALIFGVIVILPALGYLFMIFKWETLEKDREVLGED